MKKNIEEVKNIVLENDYEEAQRILNLGEYTRNFDSEWLYNPRVESENFNKVFKVKVERTKDYERFLRIMEREKRKYVNNENSKVKSLFEKGLLTMDEAMTMIEKNEYDNRIAKFKVSYDEWKSGKLSNGQRLGKTMRKAGFSQELLDFYSQQIKTEKELFLTITDKVQFIVGMSYYSTGEWDGMGGKTCQCPVIGKSYARHLAGALHDDKLFVGFLHENLEDLKNMEGKMLARTVFRLLEDFEDGQSIIVATRYYGDNVTKNLLHEALKAAETVYPIYSSDALGIECYSEPANGYAEAVTVHDIYVYHDDTHYINIDCPLCYGAGTMEAYDENDCEHTITCPHCHGDGTVEIEHYIEIDEYVEVESSEEILPYDEEYTHRGYSIDIYIDMEYIEERMKERRKEEEVEEGN